jgi:chondroitin 4-sulfotransferase 11
VVYSEQAGVVFVHIQKTGGSSIKQVLEAHCPDVRRIPDIHATAQEGKAFLGAKWDCCFKFAFVRNPWDRLVSWYSMICQHGSAQGYPLTWRKRWRANAAQRRWHEVMAHCPTFEKFIERCIGQRRWRNTAVQEFSKNQIDYLTGHNGELLVDQVGRFENFAADAQRLLECNGISIQNLPQANVSKRRPYKEYYTDRTRDLVGECFTRDISFFGYTFDKARGARP